VRRDPIIVDDCIDDMHAGTTRMVLDDFGRCAYCVKLGFWRPDA